MLQMIPLSVDSTGYFHHTLAQPIDLKVGYILGVRISDTGAQIGYETVQEGSPVELQYAGSDHNIGGTLSIGNKTSGHHIRHHLQATAVQPTQFAVKHDFDAGGFYDVKASVSDPSLGAPVEAQTVVVVLGTVEGIYRRPKKW